MVGQSPRTQERDYIGVSRVQLSRVERAVVGGYSVRYFTLVNPQDRRSRFNSYIGHIEVMVCYGHRGYVLDGHWLHALVVPLFLSLGYVFLGGQWLHSLVLGQRLHRLILRQRLHRFILG